VKQVMRRRRILVEGLPGGLTSFCPSTAFYLYGTSRFTDDSLDFASACWRRRCCPTRASIRPVHGREFVRFLCGRADMHEAVERIGKWLRRVE